MKTLIIFTALSFLLTSCGKKETKDISPNYDLSDGLSDCKIHLLRSESAGMLHVVRCPNSQTTTKDGGKYPNTVTTIEKLEKEVADKKVKLEALKKLTPEERKSLGLE